MFSFCPVLKFVQRAVLFLRPNVEEAAVLLLLLLLSPLPLGFGLHHLRSTHMPHTFRYYELVSFSKIPMYLWTRPRSAQNSSVANCDDANMEAARQSLTMRCNIRGLRDLSSTMSGTKQDRIVTPGQQHLSGGWMLKVREIKLQKKSLKSCEKQEQNDVKWWRMERKYTFHTWSPAQEGSVSASCTFFSARLGTQTQTVAQWCIKPPWSRGANHIRPRVKRVFLNIH